ncbi:DedA protein [Pediococcus damnosus]|uniref:DedA protein n=1 Tax=Pediococcus damnosus TaxID=51663 RepID=A0A0R2HGQ0_9LACO|nr:VTT domain-containing protein [Pediococcus damnosus]AMV60378.1 DedA protein [Pediococcus damnosus]AMV63221.1 DedA protein [Pediococcus damnosus]AMV64628.1 DedA protein [Pediococcus damnosus]AMV66884.1 DedA protein [Pediococcus damnosus]AMV69510.1 DedA protein [Pediococcus damnosus]
MITTLLTGLLNMNHLLPHLIAQYGSLVYVGLFALIFIETGLVIFPFLPGDSILFLSGSIAAMSTHSLNYITLIVLLSIAAIAGDSLNFELGHHFGGHLSSPKWQRWIKPKYLAEAELFFKKYGNWAIFLGRFIPIIRTFVPFTAGISKMHYRQFILYNVIGGITWVSIAVLSGYFFGNIPIIKAHFELIMLAIVLISLIPMMVMLLKRTRKGSDSNAEE